MSIEEPQQVDFVTIDARSGNAVLVISDHLPWNQDESGHLVLLQDKINNYVQFIKSGQLLSQIPASAGRELTIRIRAQYALSAQGDRLIQMFRDHISNDGITIEVEIGWFGTI